MSTKGTIRKRKAEIADDHERFLVLVAEKRPELEIMKVLGLSKTQLKDHTLKALQKGEVSPDKLIPDYEVVFARSLPTVIKEWLPLKSAEEAEALVKVEAREEGVLLTLLATPQHPAIESVPQDADGEEAATASVGVEKESV